MTNRIWTQARPVALEVCSLEVALALLKRGFVGFPRLVIDYADRLDLTYELVGKLVTLLCEPEVVSAQSELPLGEYRLQTDHPDRFYKMRELLRELEEGSLVRWQPGSDLELRFDLLPLLSRLRSILEEEYQSWGANDKEVAVTREDSAPETPPTAVSFLDKVNTHQPVLRYAQERLGRPLSDREVTDIVDWITAYGYDDRVVRAVIDEGIEKGVTRFSYLNQIARRWHEEGIRSVDDIERLREDYRRLADHWGRVIQHLGLSRRLTRAEQKLFEKWTANWGFSEDVILRACDETIYAKHPSFAYVDRVLDGWLAQGVKTVSDAERVLKENRRKAPRPAGGNRGQRTPANTADRPANVLLRRTDREDSWYEQFIEKLK